MASAVSLEDDFERLSLTDEIVSLDDERLECHFKWKPELGGSREKIPKLEKKLLKDLNENPHVRIQTFSLLGYILTLDDDTIYPYKSREYFEKSLIEAGDAEDKRFVAEANLLISRKESGNYTGGLDEEISKLKEKWRAWRKREPRKLAFTYGCHAIALSKFGPNKVSEAIEQYDKALALDPDNWNWVFGKALMLERRRALNQRDIKPSEEIRKLFEKAVELSHSNEYVLAFYATCLTSFYKLTYVFTNSSAGRGKNSHKRPDNEACRELFPDHAQNDSFVNSRGINRGYDQRRSADRGSVRRGRGDVTSVNWSPEGGSIDRGYHCRNKYRRDRFSRRGCNARGKMRGRPPYWGETQVTQNDSSVNSRGMNRGYYQSGVTARRAGRRGRGGRTSVGWCTERGDHYQEEYDRDGFTRRGTIGGSNPLQFGRGGTQQTQATQCYERDMSPIDKEQQLLKNKITALLQEAKDKGIKSKSVTVLKRCCKGYRDMKWFRDFKDCQAATDRIAKEEDSGVLHQKAKYLMKSNNLKEAKACLERAIAIDPSGFFMAAIDLIEVKLSLREKIHVDLEHERLLARYKLIQHDVAVIHESWAKSIKKTEPERVLDQVFHLKEAVKNFDPSVVRDFDSWPILESICSQIVVTKPTSGDVTYQRACKDLAWLYFVPEPKSKDNLKKSEKYLALLEEDNFHQSDIELYGQLLCEMNRYEEALEQFEKLEDKNETKHFHKAKCFFYLGKQKLHDRNLWEDARGMFLKSIQNGCLDGCEHLLHLLEKCEKSLQCRYCGHMVICLDNYKKFTLGGTTEVKGSFIKTQVEGLLGISGPMSQIHEDLKDTVVVIRKLILDLNSHHIRLNNSALPRGQTTKLLSEKANDLLGRARSFLDHLHNKLQAKLCPESLNKVYFPIITEKQRPKDKDPGSHEAKDWACENITKRFKNDFGDKDGSKGVADKCKDLIEFIALHQPYTDPERYDWLYNAWDVVNVIKRQKNIKEIEWEVPGKEQKVNLVDLAQKLAFYAEAMLQEYCKLF